MNTILLTVCSNLEATRPLVASLTRNNWDYDILVREWRGFGTKLLSIRDYLLEHTEIERFFFVDAYDVIVFGGMEEAVDKVLQTGADKMICSAERGCWPDDSLERFYEPVTEGGWDYLNSGSYYCPREIFLEMMERWTPAYEDDDQLYLTKQFLFERTDMVLDREQLLFNSHSFIREGEYGYKNGRVQVNGVEPVFVHSNGRTTDERLDELVKSMI